MDIKSIKRQLAMMRDIADVYSPQPSEQDIVERMYLVRKLETAEGMAICVRAILESDDPKLALADVKYIIFRAFKDKNMYSHDDCRTHANAIIRKLCDEVEFQKACDALRA